MKTLLVLAPHPELAEAVRAAVDSHRYRVVHRANPEEAEPMLAHGLADACILDVELTNVQGIWFLEKLRRRAQKVPFIIYTGASQWEWEEEAYLQGATQVLKKPVRGRMLNVLLDRLWQTPAAPIALPAPAAYAISEAVRASAPVPQGQPSAPPGPNVLRDFSNILRHSLDAEAMLDEFLELFREIFGVNRAAIFLRAPLSSFSDPAAMQENRRLRGVSSLGMSQAFMQNIELSLEAGIGAQVIRLGRILRRQSDEARADADTLKEFELLGAQVAVPILDRESLVGIAMFDSRITGEPLANADLELIFHLLGQVAMAVKNIWLHSQVAGNHEMMAAILRELNSACVVVSRDLAILHANKMARKYFGSTERQSGDLEFSDLPQVLGAKVYQVLKTGSAISAFKFEPEGAPSGTVYSVNIVPFQKPQAGVPGSALLMAEDLSQSRQLQKLEIEAANLRLVKSMADRLTHEIGNAMVPLSTHQQLLADKWKDPEFRASLDTALADGVKRVTRLINQMRFLARDALFSADAFPLGPLIEEAFQEARKYQPVKSAQLKYESGSTPVVLMGDRAALKHAFAEVMLNALQANPSEPRIGVRLQPQSGDSGPERLQIEVRDNGAGFTPETAEKAPAPFFTTRNVGLGLGLTVTRKIIETHHGQLEIIKPKIGESGVVRISLPVESAPS